MVAGDHIALLVHTQATVSIAVKGKADVQPVLYHELLQALNMRRTCIVVDIQTVRLVVDDVGVCAQSIEHRLGNVPACTVGAIQTDLHALERVDAQRDQVAHVAVATSHIVHSAANVFPMSERQLRPILIKDVELAIDVVLYQQQSLLRHFLAVAVDQLDAVVVIWIMACRDHDAAIKVIHTGDVGHRRSGGNMEQIGIRARSSQTSHQTVFKHIGAAARILTNDDTGRLIISVALTESIIVPAEETTYFVGVVGG